MCMRWWWGNGGGAGGLKEKARNKYINLSEEEKEVKGEYGRNSYINLIKKCKLTEY